MEFNLSKKYKDKRNKNISIDIDIPKNNRNKILNKEIINFKTISAAERTCKLYKNSKSKIKLNKAINIKKENISKRTIEYECEQKKIFNKKNNLIKSKKINQKKKLEKILINLYYN